MLNTIIKRNPINSLRRFASTVLPWRWDDPLSIEQLLTEDEILIRDTAFNYAQSKLEPRILELHRSENFERKIFEEMGELGFLGPTLPSKYNCSEVGYVSYGLICREMSRVDSGFRSALSVQSSLAMHPINKFGSEAQKEFYLPKMSKGELVGCMGLSEPNAGSDPGSMKTTAKLVNDTYILNGTKTFITNAPIADVFIIWAKDENKKIRGFIVDKDTKGLSVSTITGKLSLRGSKTGMIFLDNVELPKSAELPFGKGFPAVFSCLNSARYGISWGVMGAAEACYGITRQYTLDRIQFNKPLAANQLIQLKFADMCTEIGLGLNACVNVGRQFENGTLNPVTISILKRNNCQKAQHITRTCRDMLGGNGVVDEYRVMRHMMNMEAVSTTEGTHDIHAMIIGRAITDIGAF